MTRPSRPNAPWTRTRIWPPISPGSPRCERCFAICRTRSHPRRCRPSCSRPRRPTRPGRRRPTPNAAADSGPGCRACSRRSCGIRVSPRSRRWCSSPASRAPCIWAARAAPPNRPPATPSNAGRMPIEAARRVRRVRATAPRRRPRHRPPATRPRATPISSKSPRASTSGTTTNQTMPMSVPRSPAKRARPRIDEHPRKRPRTRPAAAVAPVAKAAPRMA